MSNPLPRALPWASAAGVAVLVAGVVAGQVGAGAEDSANASMAGAAAPAAAAPEGRALPAPAADTEAVTPAGTRADAAGSTASASTSAAGSAAEGRRADTTVVPAEVADALEVATEHLTSGKAAAAGRAFSFLDAGYASRLSSAALVPVDSAAPSGIGYSAVSLTKTAGAKAGACDIVGAGYWLSDPVEGAYANPTASRAHASGAGASETPAAVRAPGVRWDASCSSDTAGRAVANTVEAAGVAGLGSTVSAQVDRTTGEYVGTARSYVVGMATASGVLDSVTSLVQVRQAPGRAPVVTYRLTLADAGRVVTLAGTDVAASALRAQLARQVAAHAEELGAISPAVRVVVPRVAGAVSAPVVMVGRAAIGQTRFAG